MGEDHLHKAALRETGIDGSTVRLPRLRIPTTQRIHLAGLPAPPPPTLVYPAQPFSQISVARTQSSLARNETVSFDFFLFKLGWGDSALVKYIRALDVVPRVGRGSLQFFTG